MNNIEFSNISETVLLLNGSIIFNLKDRRRILMRTPNIGDIMKDEERYNRFLGICYLEVKDFKDIEMPFAYNSNGSLKLGLISNDETYRETVLYYFEKYIDNISLRENFIYVDDTYINEHELEYIFQVFMVSAGLKPIENIDQAKILEKQKEEDRIKTLSAAEKRHMETMKRLDEAKARKAARNKKEKGTLTRQKVIIGVMESFKYTINDIKELNYFGLYHLFGYFYAINNYDIMKQMYATGNMGKDPQLPHWLD